ncbi:MAG: rRNA maturation RNase YbeY [Chitinispirillaceae bacterium]|nr:rRNA maturation RNase YbeY [Chitinispirillaceae bacterium]
MAKKKQFLEIFYLTRKKRKLPIKKLYLLCSKIYKKHKRNPECLTNLIFCGNKKIRELNKIYRKKDKATDVLSFPFRDKDLLGEIYISIDKAEEQAKKFDTSLEKEILRLFVHGLLHLEGYEHKKREDREIMEALENFYLRS